MPVVVVVFEGSFQHKFKVQEVMPHQLVTPQHCYR